MASPFPISPENGDTYTAFGRTYEYSSLKSAWHPVSIAPKTSEIIGVDQFETPDVGDILVSDGTLFTKSTPNLPKIYPTIAELPLSGNIVGDIAVVSENNRVYIWTGGGWFSVALINTSPTITVGPNATYTLNNDGTPTVITLAAVDPEEVPIAWTYSVTSGSLEDTTVTNDGPEFTITPGTVAATFDLTFTASDGINLAQTSASSFTLSFVPDWSSGGTQESVIATSVADVYLAEASISDDGTIAVVGSTSGDDSIRTFRVFTRSGSTWSLAFTATTPNIIAERYAESVSISGNGTTIAVSRSGDDRPGGNYGSFEIWTGSGSSWSLQKTINGTFSSYFGHRLKLSQDGQRVLVGSMSNPKFLSVYQKSGLNWNLRGDTNTAYPPGQYEYAHALSGSSNLDVICCQYQDAASSGTRFVIFEWNGSSYQSVYNVAGSFNFGFANAVSPDGARAIYSNGSSVYTVVRNSALNWSAGSTVLTSIITNPARFKFSNDSDGDDLVLITGAAYDLNPVVYKFNRGSWGEGYGTLQIQGWQGSKSIYYADISYDGKYIVLVNTGDTRSGVQYNSGAVYFFKAN